MTLIPDFQNLFNGHFKPLISTISYGTLGFGSSTPLHIQGCFPAGEGEEGEPESPPQPPATGCPPFSGNYICNGDLELVDGVVKDNQPIPGVFLRGQYFIANNHLINWQHTSLNADLFWRGDQHGHGIPTNFKNTFASNSGGVVTGLPGIPNSIQTWDWSNPDNDIYIGLGSGNVGPNGPGIGEEGIESGLYSALDAKAYRLSFYALTASEYETQQNSNHKQYITLTLRGSGGQTHEIGGTYHTLDNYTSVSNNNGWYYFSIVFNIPARLHQVLNSIEIKAIQTYNGSNLHPPIYTGEYNLYTFFDDFVLEDYTPPSGCNPNNFPQAIPLTHGHHPAFDRYLDIDANDNVYVAGTEMDLNTLSPGYYFKIFDDCGNEVHSTYNSSANKAVRDLVVTDNGNVFIAFEDKSSNPTIYYVEEYSSNGSFVLTSSTTTQPIYDLELNPAQSRLLVANGNNVSNPIIGGASLVIGVPNITTYSNFAGIYRIGMDPNGDMYLGGLVPTTVSFNKILIEKYDASGQRVADLDIEFLPSQAPSLGSPPGGLLQWEYANKLLNREWLQDIHIDGSDNVLITGVMEDEFKLTPPNNITLDQNFQLANGLNRGYLIKLGSDLNPSWSKFFGSNQVSGNAPTSISTDPQDNILVAGYYNQMLINGATYSSTSEETFVASFDPSGSFRWFVQTTGTGGRVQYDYVNRGAVIDYQPSMDNFIVSASFAETSTESFYHGTLNTTSQTNAFVCNVNDLGTSALFSTNSSTGSVWEGNFSQSSESSFLKEGAITSEKKVTFDIFPNPSAGKAKIKFREDLANNEQVKIRIIDPVGKVVYSEISSFEDNMTLNLHDLSPGIYLVKLQYTGNSYISRLKITQ